jgi:hypothetical protein
MESGPAEPRAELDRPIRLRAWSSDKRTLKTLVDRLIKLRAWSSDKRTLETFTALINETEEKLRQREDALARS